METWSDRIRFWAPFLVLLVFAGYTSYSLIGSHIEASGKGRTYDFERALKARRGGIYDVNGTPLAKSAPIWEYRLDPVDMTNVVVRPKRNAPARTPRQIVNTIADALQLDRAEVLEMSQNTKNRYQLLGESADVDAHAILTSKYVAGVCIGEKQRRDYVGGRSLCHVLGAVNFDFDGVAGIEQGCSKWLVGTPGRVRGKKDALGRELYDRREISIEPVPGADVYLTIDRNIQHFAEAALADGVKEFGAGAGWCIVMNAKTGAILAMASVPDFDPAAFNKATDRDRINRAVAYTYEPGSVMKVITAATAIDQKIACPTTRFNTNQHDERYYRLPGDKGHVWEPTMTLTEAIVHSSNIVIGKLGYDMGPKRLYEGMRNFGFGGKTGIELPGEESGLLFDPAKRSWDKATWSRAAIGQAFSVTAIQLISAYQAIANNGMRMKPYLIDRIVAPDGLLLLKNEPRAVKQVIKESTAKKLREMMRGVAAPGGTARRAAISGYSVAGKTGTAQKVAPGGRGYLPGVFRATFCGMVPASAPEVVVLVTLDFDEKRLYHQGGNSAGPVFKRIAMGAVRYLMIPKDLPDDADFLDDDDFDRYMDRRVAFEI